ncbi:MAG: hypothetical protein K9J27_13170 [Bacteroidales bacterium]|nr:hypothetical protein [Bacteroidales bacterium]MCF8334941.1 hypothetical protein [Bacteroidales bacterium]
MYLLKKFKLAASSLAVISLLVIGTTSCDELKDKTKQKVEVNPKEISFNVDSSSFNSTKATNENVVILDTLISVNVAEVLEDNGYSIDNLSNGILIEAELFPNDPFEPENPFHFMSGATLKVGNEGEELVTVAQITEIDDESNTVVFETFGENIMQYLETDPLHLVLTVDRHGPMKADMMEFGLDNTYEVEVEIL